MIKLTLLQRCTNQILWSELMKMENSSITWTMSDSNKVKKRSEVLVHLGTTCICMQSCLQYWSLSFYELIEFASIILAANVNNGPNKSSCLRAQNCLPITGVPCIKCIFVVAEQPLTLITIRAIVFPMCKCQLFRIQDLSQWDFVDMHMTTERILTPNLTLSSITQKSLGPVLQAIESSWD